MSGDDVLDAVARAAQREPATVDAEGRRLAPPIDGVVVKRLTAHFDHRGDLAPFLDVRDPFWAEPVVYAYRISINPGVIKGWGMHEQQADRYYAADGSVRVVLFDGRAESPTAGALAELQFGERNPGLVYIPPGVWHADQNWGDDARKDRQLPDGRLHPRRAGQAQDRPPQRGHPVRLDAARRLISACMACRSESLRRTVACRSSTSPVSCAISASLNSRSRRRKSRSSAGAGTGTSSRAGGPAARTRSHSAALRANASARVAALRLAGEQLRPLRAEARAIAGGRERAHARRGARAALVARA